MEEIHTKECFEKADIKIKLSPIHRYGVFAKKDIAPKETIEECPALIFDTLKKKHIPSIIDNRLFHWDEKNSAIALGYGCIYNHSEQSNAEYIIDHQNQTISFVATKHIPAETEILVDYGPTWFSSRNMITKSQKDSAASMRIIILFLLLLVLSKIFPVGLSHITTNSKPGDQPATTVLTR